MSDRYNEPQPGSSASGPSNNQPEYGQRTDTNTQYDQYSYDPSQQQYDQSGYGQQQYGDPGHAQQGGGGTYVEQGNPQGGYPTYYQNDAGQQYAAPGQYGSQDYYPGNEQKPEGRGLAIASLVLGIVGLLTFWIFGLGGLLGLVGLILGIVSLIKLRKTPGSGKGLAIAGIVLSTLALIAGALIAALFFWAFGLVGDCSVHIESGNSEAYSQCVDEKVTQELDA